MEKIKTVTITPTTYDTKRDWRDILEEIKEKTDNFSLEKMCEDCIKKQLSYGVRDTVTGKLKTTIKCTGLTTMKNTLEVELGEKITDDFYNKLLGTAGSGALQKAEEFENSYYWIENNIVDPDIFKPREHQKLINHCSANRKVLRMGRRCVSADTILVGNQKNYKAKHLWHLVKHDKKRPFIQVLDDTNGEITYSDQYIILPNGIKDVHVITVEDGFELEITNEHPILIYSNKHYHFEEAFNLEIGQSILTPDNKLKKIINIEIKKNVFTYHISVLKYQTFVTKGGFISHNTGKCITLDTPIPTPSGWKTMGDIQVGDKVFGVDGKQYNVTSATDPMYGKDCYEITFSDGTKVECDYSHLWNVTTVNSRRYDNNLKQSHREFTLNTEDMFKDFHKKIYGVKLTKPVEYQEKDLLVDPYILGYWLGDGSIGSGSFTVGDEDSAETIQRFAEKGYILEKKKSRLHHSVKGLWIDLKTIGTGTIKRIPKEYLQGSVEQRFELLKGLLDSDGGINSRDRDIEFSTCFEKLGKEVYELICSLGIKATLRKNKSYLNGENKKDRYRILFKTNYEVFHLKRKLDKQVLTIGDKVKSKYNIRYIKDIRKIESKPVKCISVDSPDRLYLITESFIPTHNTFSMAIGMLHRLLTRKNYEVLMIAPMVTMINEVVDQIKKFCDELPVNPIIRSAQNPINLLVFNTGSTFKGVPAGASGAKGARGKSCLSGSTRICIETDTLDINNNKIKSYFYTTMEEAMNLDDTTFTENTVDLYTVYKTTNKVNNKTYIGFHSVPQGEAILTDFSEEGSVFKSGYLGSGKILKQALELYGPDNFKQEILLTTKSRKEAEALEKALVNKEWVESDDNYNLSIGGNVCILYGEANGFYGKKHTKETVAKIQESRNKTKEATGFTNVNLVLAKDPSVVFRTYEEFYEYYCDTSLKTVEKYFQLCKAVEEGEVLCKNDSLNESLRRNYKLRLQMIEEAPNVLQKKKDACSERFKGKLQTEEHKAKKNASVKAWIKNNPIEHEKRMQLINKSPEKIAKTAEKHRGMKRSLESKINMALSQKQFKRRYKNPIDGKITTYKVGEQPPTFTEIPFKIYVNSQTNAVKGIYQGDTVPDNFKEYLGDLH